jgi:ATP-dependent DNA helicase RecG
MNLTDPVSKLPGVGQSTLGKLEKLNIFNISDLLYHVPKRFNDFSKTTPIAHTRIGDSVTIVATVSSIKNIFTKSGKFIQIGEIGDNSGKMGAIWFNQSFLTRTIKAGMHFAFSGKVDWYNRKKVLISPVYENLEDANTKSIHTGRLVPIYSETKGLSSKWLRTKIWLIINNYSNVTEEFLTQKDLTRHNLLRFPDSVSSTHFPDNPDVFDKAKLRLSFNELLFNHLRNLLRKESWKKTSSAHILKIDNKILKSFTDNLPFVLTDSQKKAVSEILSDLKGSIPMNRLLEGDVGSGKTVVAAAGAFAAFVNGYQSVIMAPTQILAEQHYNTLQKLFDRFKVRVSLITSTAKLSDYGKIDIFVGTHALIHKKIKFDNVSYVVIDEQHRFGVEQRAHLIKKSGKRHIAPHVLTMTATPIPRTVALTLYGDLDLSVLSESPSGRKKIVTWLVPPQKHEKALDWIHKKIKEDGDQAYVVCPLIEESESGSMSEVKAVKKTYEDIKAYLPDTKIGLLHGKLKASEKSEILEKFKSGKIEVLVSTPVIEVGIDVPNATIMMIEGAERFGLSQLHQLRGRVGRSDKKSYCLLFASSGKFDVTQRLTGMTKSYSGFELAEIDLKMRGPGEIFGLRQHGFSDLKVASWQDRDLIKETKSLAENIIKTPKKEYSKLWKILNPEEIVAN